METDIITAMNFAGFDNWIREYAKCSLISGFPKENFDYVSYLKKNYLERFSKDSYTAIVALDEGGRLVGIAGLVVEDVNHIFAKLAVLETFYVLENFRGAGFKLLNRAKQVAKSKGCEVLSLSAPINSRLSELYSKIGIPVYQQFVLKLYK